MTRVVAADLGSTLILSGSVSGAHLLTIGRRTVNWTQSAITGLWGIAKLGGGTTTISGALGTLIGTGTAFLVDAGSLVFNGAGTYYGATISPVVNSGAKLVLDDVSAGSSADRLGYQSHYLTLNGGSFILLGAAGVGQRFSTLYLGSGASTVAVQNGGLGFTDVSSSAGSSLDFTGDFLSGGLGSISIVNPVYNGGIYVAQGVARARYTVGGTAFATLVPGVNTVLPFTAYNTSNALDIAAASDTPLLSNNTSYTASRTLNALALQGGVTLSGLQRSGALTLSSGGVLALAGMSAVDGSAGLNFGAAEALFHVAAGGTLNIAGMVAGSAGLTKTLNGILQLSSPQMYSGMTSVNGAPFF